MFSYIAGVISYVYGLLSGLVLWLYGLVSPRANNTAAKVPQAAKPVATPSTKLKHISTVADIPSGKVVIDFFANWCGPCKAIAPYYETLPAAHAGIEFVKCDVDESDALCKAFAIQAMPTFVFLKVHRKGSYTEVARVRGANKAELAAQIKALEEA